MSHNLYRTAVGLVILPGPGYDRPRRRGLAAMHLVVVMTHILYRFTLYCAPWHGQGRVYIGAAANGVKDSCMQEPAVLETPD